MVEDVRLQESRPPMPIPARQIKRGVSMIGAGQIRRMTRGWTRAVLLGGLLFAAASLVLLVMTMRAAWVIVR